MKLGDDDWAQVCAGTSFKLEWNWLQHEESYCGGSICGDKDYIIPLFHNIFRWGITGENPQQGRRPTCLQYLNQTTTMER